MKFIDKFFKNKRAIELSIQFLVIIILSLVILGFGIQYASTLFKKGTDITQVSMDQIEKQIGDIKCEEAELACLNKDHIKIGVGDAGYFSLKITNYIEPTNFSINVGFDEAYDYDKNSISANPDYMNDETKWMKYVKDDIFIQRGQSGERVFIIAADKYIDEDVYTTSGIYIYNVTVDYWNGTVWKEYDKHKVLIEVT